MKKLIAYVFVTVVAVQAIANDYIRNIKIGFKSLEGVERVIVEQLDEGFRMPGKFEVNDLQKGYFTA